MQRIIFLATIIGFIACNSTNGLAQEKVVDNQELIEIYNSDQADRITSNISRDSINYNDRVLSEIV